MDIVSYTDESSVWLPECLEQWLTDDRGQKDCCYKNGGSLPASEAAPALWDLGRPVVKLEVGRIAAVCVSFDISQYDTDWILGGMNIVSVETVFEFQIIELYFAEYVMIFM